MMPLDPAKAKVRLSFNHPSTLYCLAVNPVTGTCCAGSDDYGIHIFDPTGEKKEAIARWAGHENYVAALASFPRTPKPGVVSGSYDRQLIWWDAETGQPTCRIDAHEGWVRDLVITPDGSRVVSVGDDMRVKVWDNQKPGQLIRSLEGHALKTPQGHVTALYAVAISPDGKHLASGDRIGDVCVWELVSGKLLQRLQVPILYTYDATQRKRSLGGIRALTFSPDGTLLAVGGMGQVNNVDGLGGLSHIEIWAWRKPERRFAGGAEGHKGFVDHLQFSSQGDWLFGVGGGQDTGLLAAWKTDSLKTQVASTLPTHRQKVEGHLRRLWFNPKANELVTVGHRKLQVWTLSS